MAQVKLYVYDVPDELLYLAGECLRDYCAFLEEQRGWPLSFDPGPRTQDYPASIATAGDWVGQYGYDLVLYQALSSSALVTRDPEEADFFLVPNLATTHYAHLLKDLEYLSVESPDALEAYAPHMRHLVDRYTTGILDYVDSGFPHAGRRHGRDHVFICTWDNGVGIDEPEGPYPGNIFSDGPRRRIRDMVKIVHHGERETYEREARDPTCGPTIVIPPFIHSATVKRVLADPRSRDFSIGRRRILSFFRGNLKRHSMRQVYNRCYGYDRDMLTNVPAMRTPTFDDIRFSSLFSICLEGTTPWTTRLSQAFLYGCIPVFVSDDIVLPFEHHIDWQECALWFSPRDIPNLKSILRSLSFGEVERLQAGLVKYADALLFDGGRPLDEQGLGALLVAELARVRSTDENTDEKTDEGTVEIAAGRRGNTEGGGGLKSLAGSYPPARNGTLVFWGLLATYPFGGFTWQVLHYLLGARRLGFDVWYVEDNDAELYSTETYRCSYDYEPNLRYLEAWMNAAGLGDRWIYRPPYARDVCFGARDVRGLEALYRYADAVINVCGSHQVRDDHPPMGCLVYMETDPVTPQILVAQGDESVIEQLDRHQHHFTYGENLGAEDCRVPVERFHWEPTRPPVCVDLWATDVPPAADAALTTVTNFKFDTAVTWEGETWIWSKHRQFELLKHLPARSCLPLGLAIGAATVDEFEQMRGYGWKMRWAAEIYDPQAYRSYIRGSLGEIALTKEQVVIPRSGWFSDRSVSYLAAGRPVITQETGFSKYVPTGSGLFAYSSEEEALAAIDEVAADYDRHSAAAAEIAREYYGADRVLGDVFRYLGFL